MEKGTPADKSPTVSATLSQILDVNDNDADITSFNKIKKVFINNIMEQLFFVIRVSLGLGVRVRFRVKVRH